MFSKPTEVTPQFSLRSEPRPSGDYRLTLFSSFRREHGWDSCSPGTNGSTSTGLWHSVNPQREVLLCAAPLHSGVRGQVQIKSSVPELLGVRSSRTLQQEELWVFMRLKPGLLFEVSQVKMPPHCPLMTLPPSWLPPLSLAGFPFNCFPKLFCTEVK